ncbi:hypothetical protein PM082_021652 [Marasmius tenuissimus]|nr:hypothetical protein PM082_021652 [Marasmius tenuissimus]
MRSVVTPREKWEKDRPISTSERTGYHRDLIILTNSTSASRCQGLRATKIANAEGKLEKEHLLRRKPSKVIMVRTHWDRTMKASGAGPGHSPLKPGPLRQQHSLHSEFRKRREGQMMKDILKSDVQSPHIPTFDWRYRQTQLSSMFGRLNTAQLSVVGNGLVR